MTRFVHSCALVLDVEAPDIDSAEMVFERLWHHDVVRSVVWRGDEYPVHLVAARALTTYRRDEDES